ncbi:MAG: YkgJ family cysteine cluster protein [Fimbriimonadales bacterium]
MEQFADRTARSQLMAGPSPERLADLTNTINLKADSEIAVAHVQGPAVACRKGCAHCCFQFVTTIIPEVLHLAATIKATYTSERLAALEARIEAYLSGIESVPRPKRTSTVKDACPILENDLCGAFEARPLACRLHNSIDVEACIRYKSGERKVPALSNGAQIRIGNALLLGCAAGLRRSRLQEALVELIPALDIALRTPDAAERYLAGEPLFDAVIVAGYDPSVVRRYIRASQTIGISLD